MVTIDRVWPYHENDPGWRPDGSHLQVAAFPKFVFHQTAGETKLHGVARIIDRLRQWQIGFLVIGEGRADLSENQARGSNIGGR